MPLNPHTKKLIYLIQRSTAIPITRGNLWTGTYLNLAMVTCAELATAFAEQCPAGWCVRRVAQAGELIDWVDDDSERHLCVILPVASVYAQSQWVEADRGTCGGGVNCLPIVAAADQGSVEAAGRAIAAGATDFLVWAKSFRSGSPRCWGNCGACWM